MTIEAADDRTGGESPPATVRVWDPLVRVFHWSLVAAFFTAFFTGEDVFNVHETAGYIAGGLVAFRVVWGLVGPRHARFTDFVRGPGTILGYLRDAMAMRAERHVGHNPAGGAMIVLLLLAVGYMAVTGYMMTTDAYWGVAWVAESHIAVAYVTLGLIALHLGGVILASINHGENLARAMLNGRKRAE